MLAAQKVIRSQSDAPILFEGGWCCKSLLNVYDTWTREIVMSPVALKHLLLQTSDLISE